MSGQHVYEAFGGDPTIVPYTNLNMAGVTFATGANASKTIQSLGMASPQPVSAFITPVPTGTAFTYFIYARMQGLAGLGRFGLGVRDSTTGNFAGLYFGNSALTLWTDNIVVGASSVPVSVESAAYDAHVPPWLRISVSATAVGFNASFDGFNWFVPLKPAYNYGTVGLTGVTDYGIVYQPGTVTTERTGLAVSSLGMQQPQ